MCEANRGDGWAWGCLSLATLALTREWRNELAGGEIVQGAEAAAQLGVAQAPFAVEPAQKLLGRPPPFLRVAIQTARHQVSIGILSQLRPRHNVVEAPPVVGDPPRTIEAAAAFAGVDGLAQDLLFQEIRLLDVDNDAVCSRWPRWPPWPMTRDFLSAYPFNLQGEPQAHYVLRSAVAFH